VSWDYVQDWAELLLRWLHVIAGIVWIGTSFYFVALDNHLRPPRDRRRRDEGVAGDTWEIHGGGFYRIEKYRVAPPALPEPLHWFKWEAYWTWISGFALLVVLYWLDADVYLVDPAVRDLSHGEAIALSAGLLVAGWIVYDGLCRLLGGRELLLAVGVAGLAVAASWATSELFGGRAAYLHVGAMLGTIMVANVFFVIIPAHWELVRAKQAGREPDAAPALEAKRRSVHNNYLTLPVVFAMLSNHLSWTYGHERGWLVLVALMAIGAWTRHYFNLRHEGRTVWAIPLTAAIAVVALAVAIEPDDEPLQAGVTSAGIADVQRIVGTRCLSCHAGAGAPGGVRLETAAEIEARADRIEEVVVKSRAMPPGNVTGMTDEERATVAAWLATR
jgi:uncharacterized membrane protein